MNTLDLTRTTAEDNQLVELVEEITARLQAGEPCNVDEYAARFPEYADRLRDWMTVMSAMADLGHSLLSHKTESVCSPPLHGEGLREGSHALRSGATAGLSSSAQADGSAVGLLGDFRILREVGRGGMGVVYEAEQISLGRRVALKVLPFAAMLDRQQLARFKNEARAAATLDHPNIVAIYSVGSERGVHYYAMQLIEGQSLAQVLDQLRRDQPQGASPRLNRNGATVESSSGVEEQRSSGVEQVAERYSTTPPLHSSSGDTAPLANLPTLLAPSSSLPAFSTREYFRTIAQLGIQAAEALDHAHQNGILHRDIKPANLLVECTGTGVASSIQHPASSIPHLKLWITDFGLARMEQDAGMTMTGDLLGTLRYMSPEQALAKRVVVDHRSDIYSLGVTLYELLTLEPAFPATDRQELLHQIAFDEPRPPRQINPRIPADLETIALQATRKEPDHRYATAHDLAEDLQRFLDDHPIKAKPPTWREHVVRWTRRHPAAVWAALLFLVATAIISTASALLITGAYKRANTETAKTKAVADLLRNMLASSYPDRIKDSHYTVRELLDDFSAGLDDQLANQPEVEAAIRSVIGTSYWRLGAPDRADLNLKRALNLHRQVYGANDERLANSLIDYAWNLGEQNRFAEVQECAREAALIYQRLESDPQVTGALANALYVLAVAQLRQGDKAGYRATCTTLVDLPVRSADVVVNSRPVWPLCLAPGALDDMSRLVNRAEQFVADNSRGEPHFCLYVLGAALYRAGHYERAAQQLEESIEVYPGIPVEGCDTINYQQLLLAMSNWQLGRQDEARQLLAEIYPAIVKELQAPSMRWNRRTSLELLRDEAKALIKPKETDEAVENGKPNESTSTIYDY